MRTLNEQIQRLRDVLVTCYNAIKRKGGTIPEEGERNMTNLPAAVLSIPQTHGVLTELEVTANGVYLPEEGADGFSKVTARFDTSSLPKVKVVALRVTNDCINEGGRWEGEILIDTSILDSIRDTFNGCSKLVYLDSDNWNTSNITNMVFTFGNCHNVRKIGTRNWDTKKVTSLNATFSFCRSLEELDLTNWDVTNVTNVTHLFNENKKLQSLIGNLSDVDLNTISCLNGLNISINLSATILDRPSLRAVINGLADVNDLPAESRPTLTLGTTLLAKLTDEDKAIVTEKGWNFA